MPSRVIFHPLSAEPEEEDKRTILKEVQRRLLQHRLDQISCHSVRLPGAWHRETNGLVVEWSVKESLKGVNKDTTISKDLFPVKTPLYFNET